MAPNKKVHDSEVLQNGQQVITACAFIYHSFDGIYKVFVPRRSATKKFLPDTYELPGGHIEYGKDIIKGLKREIMEEFGMKIAVGDAYAAFTYLNQIKRAHVIEVIFFAQFVNDLSMITLCPDDHQSYEWIAASEIDRIITCDKSASDPEIQALQRGFLLLNSFK